MVLELVAWITMFALVAGWVVDVLLARGFTPFFAPAYAKIKRAIIYSSGRLALRLIVMGLMALTVFVCTRFVHAGIIILFVAILLMIVATIAQVGWLAFQFRMNISSSITFYVIIFGAQVLTFFLIAAPILVGKPSALAYRFVNETLTPQLQGEVDATKQDLAEITKGSEATKAKIDEIQNKIAQDQAETEKLNLQIETKKNSEAFLFQEIVKVEAAGDLASAHDQFTAMLAKYPSGTLADSVKTHLAQVDSELAIQEAQKKQAEADAIQAAALARADLIARAAKGEVELSEMRLALVGKNRTDVTALFGPPTESASERWGYGQQMVIDPMTKEKHGLAIYFSEGVVQSFDYYYGGTK
jgi:hypothetical protein